MGVDKSLRERYNERYSAKDFPHFRLADRLIIKSIVDKFGIQPDSRFLDVGCGMGKFTKYMSDYGLKSVGVDLSDVAIDVATKRYPECEFRREDLTKPNLFENESFDGIFCHGYSLLSHELEPVKPDIRVLVNYLKKGGQFIVVMTTTLADDKPKEDSRTNYRIEHWIDFFKGFDDLEIISAYTLQPHLFIPFRRFTFNQIFSKICRYITVHTGLPLRAYIFLKKI